VQIGGCRLLLFTVSLRNEQDDLVLGQRGFDRCERCGPPDEERDDYIGENDNIPKRKDRDPVRRRDALVVALESLRQALGFLLPPHW
jgi:hypothetical protein